MLSGRGFNQVVNLSGGIKAWNGEKAFYGEEKGLALFDGSEGPKQTLTVAYSLEAGLREFYLSMIDRVKSPEAGSLFGKLSQIEVKHQDRLFRQYLQLSGETISRESFEATAAKEGMEGGLSTEEYIGLFNPDFESTVEVAELAMSIEAQAMDLYLRAAERAADQESREFLEQIAGEEQAHLRQLGELLESELSERT